MAQTDRQTDGHGDLLTNSTQWGRVGEKEDMPNTDTKFMDTKIRGDD